MQADHGLEIEIEARAEFRGYLITGFVGCFCLHPDSKFVSDLVARVNLRQELADLCHRATGEAGYH